MFFFFKRNKHWKTYFIFNHSYASYLEPTIGYLFLSLNSPHKHKFILVFNWLGIAYSRICRSVQTVKTDIHPKFISLESISLLIIMRPTSEKTKQSLQILVSPVLLGQFMLSFTFTRLAWLPSVYYWSHVSKYAWMNENMLTKDGRNWIGFSNVWR